ncbi:hypothetical protein [Micromonospora sp. NPDC023956]|uniref:hypothetical protein n=1 Tax=Micromonospora sp. NPDC023956 TaxID=3155722 RepID=UPI0033EA04C4
MTGRGAAREHEQPPPGRAVGAPGPPTPDRADDDPGSPPADPADPAAGGTSGDRQPHQLPGRRAPGGGVPPRPRPHPREDPAPDQPPHGPERTEAGDVPDPTAGAPDAPPTGAGTTTGAVTLTAATGVEPTTGAPVGAVPHRVPIRQHLDVPRPDGSDDDGVDGSDFWLPIEEVHWDGTPIRVEQSIDDGRAASAVRARDRLRTRPRVVRQRDPLPGLAGLLGLSLLAAFFAWVSAEPFWLAVGHGTTGTVVGECTGDGLAQRCRGTFAAADGRFVAHGVRIGGIDTDGQRAATAVPARMTGPDGATAYADGGGTLHLRWLLGFGLVAACAAGIPRVTGTAGLTGRRARRWAITAAAGGPLVVTVGFLVTAF